jgi:hypothetical protein
MTFPVIIPNIKVYQGDTFTASYVFNDKTTGLPINLVTAGWASWTAQWRPSSTSTDVVNFTVDATYASTGRIIVTATPVNTRLVKDGVWDLQATQSGTVVRTWIRGRVEGIGDVTRAT